MAKKTDPFSTLTQKSRRITPRMLKGTEKQLWEEFKAKYHNGEFAGLPLAALFDWGQQNCGLTCSVSCFRNELLR